MKVDEETNINKLLRHLRKIELHCCKMYFGTDFCENMVKEKNIVREDENIIYLKILEPFFENVYPMYYDFLNDSIANGLAADDIMINFLSKHFNSDKIHLINEIVRHQKYNDYRIDEIINHLKSELYNIGTNSYQDCFISKYLHDTRKNKKTNKFNFRDRKSVV